MATKLAAEQAAELAVDREQRILLQVSLRFLWLEPEVDLRKERLGCVSDDAGTFTGALYQQGQRGEFLILWKWGPELKIKTGGAARDQWGLGM